MRASQKSGGAGSQVMARRSANSQSRKSLPVNRSIASASVRSKGSGKPMSGAQKLDQFISFNDTTK